MFRSTALHDLTATGTLVRTLGCILLASVMFLAQTLLALHDVEHLGQVEQDQCETCVAGASLGTTQVAAGLWPVPCARPPASQSTAIARPVLRATFNAHPPRAPPGELRHGPR